MSEADTEKRWPDTISNKNLHIRAGTKTLSDDIEDGVGDGWAIS